MRYSRRMNFNCPLCDAELVGTDGEKMHPGNPAYGRTLECPNTKCMAQEVMGHGDNDKQAFEVIKQKYHKD
jgi:hypothetical protein